MKTVTVRLIYDQKLIDQNLILMSWLDSTIETMKILGSQCDLDVNGEKVVKSLGEQEKDVSRMNIEQCVCSFCIVSAKLDREPFFPDMKVLELGYQVSHRGDCDSIAIHVSKNIVHETRQTRCYNATDAWNNIIEKIKQKAVLSVKPISNQPTSNEPTLNAILNNEAYKKFFKPQKIVFISTPEQLFVKQARELLHDYARKGSGFWRMIHPMRHYVKDVRALLNQYSEQASAVEMIEGMEKIVAAAKKTGKFNPNGSLSRRVRFLTVQKEYLDPQVKEASANQGNNSTNVI